MMRFLFLTLLFFSPFLANGSVVINEIAWMGTENDWRDEWIEIYNSSQSVINLDGWILEIAGSKEINLAGEVSPTGYYLIERTNDDSVPDIAADLVSSFGRKGLKNDGALLILKNSNGVEIQRIDAGGGWLAGDNSTKQTMQWNGSSWITASPTPGVQNSGVQQEQVPEEEPIVVEAVPEPESAPTLPPIEPELEPQQAPPPVIEEQNVRGSVTNTDAPDIDELNSQIEELKKSLEEMQAIATKSESTTVVDSEEPVKYSVSDTATQTQVANAIAAAVPNQIRGTKWWLLAVLGFGIFTGVGFVFIRRQSLS